MFHFEFTVSNLKTFSESFFLMYFCVYYGFLLFKVSGDWYEQSRQFEKCTR